MNAAVRELIRRYDMLPAGVHVLAAVSGGMDSMCLLHYLHSSGVRVTAAHLNHCLRGGEADEDERFVRAWCAERGIPCRTGAADVAALAKEHGWSIEEAGRRARYAFLERTADEVGALRIATAHHARDNAETLLFHLLRGSGTDGLGGIAPVRGRLIRPFLTVTPQQLAAYSAAHDVPFREDRSNADTAYTRNYIRHEILPALERINPAAVEHMSAAALRARRESAFLDALAEDSLRGLTRGDGAVMLAAKALADCPEALRVRALRQMLDALGAGRKDYTERHYEALERLALGKRRAQLDLPGGVTALRAGETLTLKLRRETPQETPLAVGEAVRFGGYTVRAAFAECGAAVPPGALALRKETAQRALSLGAWRPGERMTPAGAKTPRSLKRLYAEHGVTPERRDTLPVLRADGRPAAAFGVGTAAAFAPEDEGETLIVSIDEDQ